MSVHREEEKYTELFLEFCGVIEPWLKRLVILLLIGIILFQGALTIPEIRAFMSSAEKYEGTPLHKISEP